MNSLNLWVFYTIKCSSSTFISQKTSEVRRIKVIKICSLNFIIPSIDLTGFVIICCVSLYTKVKLSKKIVGHKHCLSSGVLLYCQKQTLFIKSYIVPYLARFNLECKCMNLRGKMFVFTFNFVGKLKNIVV